MKYKEEFFVCGAKGLRLIKDPESSSQTLQDLLGRAISQKNVALEAAMTLARTEGESFVLKFDFFAEQGSEMVRDSGTLAEVESVGLNQAERPSSGKKLWVLQVFRQGARGPVPFGNWFKVYDLRQDQTTINQVQMATRRPGLFGLVPEVALFGTPEWWIAIEDGRIPRLEVRGTIKRLHMTGHGDWPEFEVESSEGLNSWTRLGDESLYRSNDLVSIQFVRQRPKNPAVGRYVEQVLTISLMSPELGGLPA